MKKLLSISGLVLVVFAGSAFAYFKTDLFAKQKVMKVSVFSDILQKPETKILEDNKTATSTEVIAGTSTPTQTKGDLQAIRKFVDDWALEYTKECSAKITNECIIWKAGIDTINKNCFKDGLSVVETNKCAQDIMSKSLQSALYHKMEEATTPKPITSNNIVQVKTQADQYGVDLYLLPEGKTVKVIKNGPTDEVPFGNTTTVTYTRSGKSISIAQDIVYDGNRGKTSFKQTIVLE